MPILIVPCRNTETGAEGEVPESALPHLTNWVPLDQADTDPPADATPDEPPDGQQATPAPRTARSKAAESAKTPKED